MKNNRESGYILPITVIIIFILCAVVIEQTRHYILDKQFLAAETMIFQVEQLLQAAVVDLKQKDHEELLAISSLQYDRGTVVCTGQEIDDETVKIILQARPDNGGVRYAHVYINTNRGLVTEWWEVTR